MKIHGTAKGGALSKKDFGVAFGGAPAACTGGDELAYTTDGSRDDTHAGYVSAMKVTGVAGTCYNQIALRLQAAVGNIRLGVYNDDSGEPNDVLAQTDSIVAQVGYVWQDLEEFTIDTNVIWLCAQYSGASKTYSQSGLSNYLIGEQSFGPFVEPFVESEDADSPADIKLRHT